MCIQNPSTSVLVTEEIIEDKDGPCAAMWIFNAI